MRQFLVVLTGAALSACGAFEDPFDPDPAAEGIVEPLDDEGPAANLPEGFRLPMASCPNGGDVKPNSPDFGKSIDAYSSYVGQSTCSGTAKPGVTAFQGLVLKTYPCTSSGGIVRSCSVGGQSEHKEGRAWDWMLNYPHPAAEAFLGWLLATDKYGNKHAMARRLGIMYMIWNRKMWRAYDPGRGWATYTGSNPHTDHVHFSFSWNGANKKTSFWNPPAPPPPPPPPPPQPKPDARVRPDTEVRIDGSVEPIEIEESPAEAEASTSARRDPSSAVGGCSLAAPGAAPGGQSALLLLSLAVILLLSRFAARRRARG